MVTFILFYLATSQFRAILLQLEVNITLSVFVTFILFYLATSDFRAILIQLEVNVTFLFLVTFILFCLATSDFSVDLLETLEQDKLMKLETFPPLLLLLQQIWRCCCFAKIRIKLGILWTRNTCSSKFDRSSATRNGKLFGHFGKFWKILANFSGLILDLVKCWTNFCNFLLLGKFYML